MSLKRLLNPSSEDINEPDLVRQRHLEWDFGISCRAEPILQDQTWSNLVTEVLGQDCIQDGLDDSRSGEFYEPSALCFAQERVEQWAAENIYSHAGPQPRTPEIDDELICYGMIYRASVKLRGNMIELDKKLSTGGSSLLEGYYTMDLASSAEEVLVTFPDGTPMGEINTQLEKAFEAMKELLLQCEILAPITAIRETIGRATKSKDAIVRVNIIIYGSRRNAGQVGRELSKYKIYLQRPDYIRNGLTYDNPHFLKLHNVQQCQDGSTSQSGDHRLVDAENTDSFKKTISDIYSSLKRADRLEGLEGDKRLTTSLLPHQKEALTFMCQRENGPIPEEFELWEQHEIDGRSCYRHSVATDVISSIRQKETGGGILADEMGMGKTLSILALIIRTLESAHEWANTNSTEADMAHDIHTNPTVERSRGTLIIASSDLMINEWMQEMRKHFNDQTIGHLKTIKYHGQNRETDIAKLRDADIVLTTYHTLAADITRKRKSLEGIAWYRLVLDEAHIIRRQSTLLNGAVTQLKARSRWCLTGTPIQNRLEDIGSLFAFLRVNPFEKLNTFRKHISVPFDEGGQRRKTSIERFTRLLDSLCLRRTTERIHLPEQYNRTRKVKLSEEERAQYEDTYHTMSRAVRNQVSILDHPNTLGMFQVQLQLRILCNHGTYQQPFSWNRRKLLLQDEREDLENGLGNEGQAVCSNCHQAMPLGGGTVYKRYTENCMHVLCSDCIPTSMSGSQRERFPGDCPLCPILRQMISGNDPSQSQQPMHPEHSENYFRPYGRSSKMEALISDVCEDLQSTKSIIFSCWTHTLDLIQLYLNSASIDYRRIDGECPTAKREKILEDFAKTPDLRVLIMTTGTGAVGLNLAMANRVFLVEPQWNPSVETQAIARALRIGQQHTVQVTRYVVEKTVEQEMQSLQEKKRGIASIAWE